MVKPPVPEDIQANTRHDASQTRLLQAPKTRERRHPKFGGSEGYEAWQREDEIVKYQNGDQLAVSLRSVYR